MTRPLPNKHWVVNMVETTGYFSGSNFSLQDIVICTPCHLWKAIFLYNVFLRVMLDGTVNHRTGRWTWTRFPVVPGSGTRDARESETETVHGIQHLQHVAGRGLFLSERKGLCQWILRRVGTRALCQQHHSALASKRHAHLAQTYTVEVNVWRHTSYVKAHHENTIACLLDLTSPGS